jgi:hypothetical protein
VHGLWSAGDEPAELDVEVIFTPPGPRPEADLVWLGEWYGRLSRHGRPSLLQMAVLLEEYSEALRLAVASRAAAGRRPAPRSARAPARPSVRAAYLTSPSHDAPVGGDMPRWWRPGGRPTKKLDLRSDRGLDETWYRIPDSQ